MRARFDRRPPKQREPQKEPVLRERPKKKSLQEACRELFLERQAQQEREKHRADEEEVLRMILGPNAFPQDE